MSLTLVKYKELILENIKVVIGLGGSLLLALAIIFPTASAIPAVYQGNNKQSEELSLLNTRLKKINSMVSSQQAIKSSVILADRALPSKDDVPNLMNQVQAIATGSGVSLKSLQFNGIAKSEDGSYKKINMQAVLDGNFTNLLSMLTSLETTSRLVNVITLSFDAQKSSSGLTASLGLVSYFVDSDIKAGPGNLDFSSSAIVSTLDYIKKLKPYEPQQLNVPVGKSNPFE
jgi:Tfp pilus assembly protein PilO